MKKISRRNFLRQGAAGAALLSMAPVLPACSGKDEAAQNVTAIDQDYDVVVCGGGPSGLMAAVAAARNGCKTAIIERYGFLGGMATTGYVAPISEFAFKGEMVIGGIPWEFIQRLKEMGGTMLEMPKGNVDFDVELYKLCMQRMALEAGIDLYMHSVLTGCETDKGKVKSVTIHNKNGFESLRSKIFIDATGDADLSLMAGVPMQPSEGSLQPLSFCFMLAGVDTTTDMMQRHMHHNGLNGRSQCTAVREKLLALKEQGVEMPDFGGPWFNEVMHPGLVMVNMTRRGADATDNRDFSKTECQLREDIFLFTGLLRDNVEEFKDCYVIATAPQAGIRETRRIKGVHTLTAEEYLRAEKFKDSISRGAHPIDIHSAGSTKQVVNDLSQAAYIPYRSLVSDGFPNLIVAGRCISCDRTALASIRVQASCMGLGQAAGVAASQAIRQGTAVQDIDTDQLVGKLRSMGAVI